MDSPQPFEDESIIKFLRQCIFVGARFRKFEGDPKEKEEIVKFIKTFDPAVNNFKIKNAEALASLTFEIFSQEFRDRIAYSCIQRNLFFFFVCSDAGVFPPETAINMFNIVYGKKYPILILPEFDTIYGKKESLYKFEITEESYENIRKIIDDIDTIRKLYTDDIKTTNFSVAFSDLGALRQPLLSAAILFKSRQCIEFFLEEKKLPIDASDDRGWRPIHCACYIGDKELFERLLAKCPQDITGCLCAATLSNEYEMFDYLQEKHQMDLNDHVYNLNITWYMFEVRNYHVIFDCYPLDQLNPNYANYSCFKPILEECAPNSDPGTVKKFYG
ncbi:hypothetical protein GPJ56_005764 [Histomonas meleagridis]|uniref:uncharacterized protein n=1 Tax=Histomonas meleagridis TaxID=135588 RepID=UPI00355A9B21|nr:hypothetical protein GPJ56_005764 [Histomonas meleagridis]KAH0796164.1 hypothetical protein GO595_010057 [Histomonas meleagridis]